MKYLLTILFFAGVLLVAGQKTEKVTASGSYVSRDLTPEETRAKAIDEAKKNALIKAGISESITVSDFLYTFEDNEKFKEIFQAFTSTETGGEIIVDEILSEKRDFDEFGSMIIEVEIAATVFKHKKKKDPELVIKIENISNYYDNEDLLRFTVTPSLDGYLKIFNFTDETAKLLYPYKHDEISYLNEDTDHLFKAFEKVSFPMHPAFGEGYALEIERTNLAKEYNLMLFVYTKNNIPFMEEEMVKDILKWVYSISPDDRTVVQQGFIIQR